MTYLLDTDICVFYLTGRWPQVERKLDSRPPRDIAISAITWAELLAGAASSDRPAQSTARQRSLLDKHVCLPFGADAAVEYARIRAWLRRQGTPIGKLDTQIAAIAHVHQLVVVTHNTRHFSRVPGLPIEDWTLA